MKTGTLIPLNRANRLMAKVHGYLAEPNIFFDNPDSGITTFLDALPFADPGSLLKMIPMLGYAGRDRALWPLYRLMSDLSRSEQVRSAAAVQLCLAASLSDDPSVVNDRLIDGLEHPEPSIRSNSALALGWHGNGSAVGELMAHLHDSDRDVQAAVVTALASIGEDHIFYLLREKLELGNIEIQRSILLNIWRFAENNAQVEELYLEWIRMLPKDLYSDILAGLAMLPLSEDILVLYDNLLVDDDPRIRHQVLENLSANDPEEYSVLNDRLDILVKDSDDLVRQTAIRLFSRI